MKKDTTLQKEKIVIKEFQRLLRSGKDFTTESMYEDAGKKCFISWRTAGHIINNHYRNTITKEMEEFIKANRKIKFEVLIKSFCDQFKVCKREGRFIIGYIR